MRTTTTTTEKAKLSTHRDLDLDADADERKSGQWMRTRRALLLLLLLWTATNTALTLFALLPSHSVHHPLLARLRMAPSRTTHLPRAPASSAASAGEAANHLHLLTWNVRYDTRAQNRNQTWPIDTPPAQLTNITLPNSTYPQTYTDGEFPWAYRRIALVSHILLHHPTIISMQEILPNQLADLTQLLSPTYTGIGFGRNDATGTRGEASPVFFRNDLLDLVPASQHGVGDAGYEHFWLSPTPDVAGSVGWDASQTRICTHLALRFRGEEQIIHVFSTHFDDGGVVARAESAKLIRARANEAYQRTRSAEGVNVEPLVVLMGDFNSPRRERAWRSIVAGKYGIPQSEAADANSTVPADSSIPFLDTALSVPTLFRNPLAQPDSTPSSASQSRSLSRFFPRWAGGMGKDVEPRAETGEALPFAPQPNIVQPLATYTAFQRATGRSEETDTIDFIYVLDAPSIQDTTPSSIQYPSQPSSQRTTNDNNNVAAQPHSAAASPDPAARTDTTGRAWYVAAYGVLPSWSDGEGGVRMSDHRPVLARLVRR